MKVITGKVRLNYPNLFTPVKLDEEQEAKYSLTILIPKTELHTLEEVNSAIYKSKIQLFEKYNNIPDSIKTPLRDGDIEKPDNKAYKNHYFMNITSKFKPGVVDAALNSITNPNEIYTGCYGRVSMNFYPYFNNNMCGIGCSLNNVQKMDDGELIITNSRPEDDFTVIDTTEL